MDHRETLKAIARAIESGDLKKLKRFGRLFNRYHFKHLCNVLESGKVLGCRIVGDYLVVEAERQPDDRISVIVMFDSTTERFYIATRRAIPSWRIESESDVYRLLGFDRDATRVDVIEEDDTYRVQGDLIAIVGPLKYFAIDLEDILRRMLGDEIGRVMAQRIASLLESELSLNVGVDGEWVVIELPLGTAIRRELLESLEYKVRELVEEHLEELFGDFVRFLARANATPLKAFTAKQGDEVYVEVGIVDERDEAVLREVLGDIILRFTIDGSAICIRVSVFISKIDALLNEILGKLSFETHTLNVGNHTVTMTSSTGNLFTIEIELGLRELRKARFDVRVPWILVKDSEMMIQHPEHGVKLLRVRGTKSVRFTTITNGFEDHVNKYVLEELAREYERRRKGGL